MTARFAPFLISAVVFLLDRVSKLVIRGRIGAWDTIPVIPGFFNIVHSENPGAAFGMLADSTSVLRPIFLIVMAGGVMVFITVLLLRPGHGGLGSSWLLRSGLAFVLGGAMGNVFDRLFRGTVTDFLEFIFGSYTFPAFNVADSAITVGACLLLLDMGIASLRRKEQHVSQTD